MPTSFADTARILNQMIPELEKGLNKGQRAFKYTKKLAEGLTDVQKRFKFFSKEFSQAKKQITELNKLGKEFQKVAKTTKGLKDVTDKILQKVPGKDAAQKAAKAGGNLAAIGAFVAALALFTAQTKLTEFTQYAQQQADDRFSVDLSKTLTLIGLIASRLRNTNEKIKQFELQDQRSRDRVYALETQLVPIRENANNALYETRAGRKILEGKIAQSDQRAEAARKLANDAFYEIRAGRQTIDIKVQEARKLGNDALYETRQNNAKNGNSIDNLFRQYNDLVSRVNQNLGKSIDATITAIKTDIKVAQNTAAKAQETANKTETKNTAQDKEIDAAVATVRGLARALEAVPKIFNPTAAVSPADIAELRNGLGNIKVDLSSLRQANQYQLDALSSQDKVLASGITGLASTDKELAAAIDKVDKKAIVPDLTPIQKALNDKFDAFVQQNNKDLTKSELSKEFDRRIADFTRQSTLTADQRFQEFQRQNAIDLGVKTNQLQQVDTSLKTDINGLKEDLRKVGADITGLNTKIKEREDVDIKVNEKLDKMIPLLQTIPLMPARISDTLKPSIPTLPEINNEVGKAICNNFNGGCGKAALDKQSADINNAGKANNNDLLNKLNAGANAGQLAALEVINNKLGAQIPGGIGGKLIDGFKWLQLDRILNVLTFAATVQNHLMLSNDIGQTLLGAFNNILQLIGIKDDKGQAINTGEVIGNTIENVIKGIVGTENYATLSVQWAKANRIYQASTNILNSFQGLANSILNGLELVAGQNGKIGNALKKAGQVLDDAYGWMNPQPKINRITNFLEGLQQGSSTIQQVTQVPLDIISQTTELTNSSTELIKAWKEDDKPQNKAATIPEPDKLKADEGTAAAASAGKETQEVDLEADE